MRGVIAGLLSKMTNLPLTVPAQETEIETDEELPLEAEAVDESVTDTEAPLKEDE